uniref:FLZ-type domain-containing protein n=1 Tax=Musa acuminata subsp. malaccensis TaxID=214687 RepID=A0A804K8V5_MUSAM|nr:PREDICTED: protein MARD1-like isoform X2 [Musa acuminata subsp. malaccensis]
MLRRRSKAVGGKQGLMSDPYSLSSSSGNSHNKPTASSLFPSPSLFRSFSSKSFSDHEAAMMSPTSILETKHLSSFGNLLHSDTLPKNPPLENASAAATDTVTESKHHPWDSSGQEPIGLGIVDALTDDKAMQSSNPQRRMVLFGSQLKIQIPSVCSSSGSPPARSMELPSSPIEFGIKNKDSQLALFSPVLRSLGHEAPAASSSPWAFTTGSISVSEMELSEDYTCVISHGPNPKTTHIFDNCIVESCGDEFTAVMKESSPLPSHEGCSADDFLCCACKKNLGEEMDIPVNRCTSLCSSLALQVLVVMFRVF